MQVVFENDNENGGRSGSCQEWRDARCPRLLLVHYALWMEAEIHALSVTGNDARHVDFRQRHIALRAGGRARKRAMMPMISPGWRAIIGECMAQTQVGPATPDSVTQRNDEACGQDGLQRNVGAEEKRTPQKKSGPEKYSERQSIIRWECAFRCVEKKSVHALGQSVFIPARQ